MLNRSSRLSLSSHVLSGAANKQKTLSVKEGAGLSRAEKSLANALLNEPSADCSSRALGSRALSEVLNVITGHLFYTGACDKQLFNAAPPLSAQPQSAISAFV